MVKIPKLKKKVKSFLIGEDGKVSKSQIISTASVLGVMAIAASVAKVGSAAEIHKNELSLTPKGNSYFGTHGHHGSHSSY